MTEEPTAEELAKMSPLEFNAYAQGDLGRKMAASDERKAQPGSPFWHSADSEGK